jgi:hypothetical protein
MPNAPAARDCPYCDRRGLAELTDAAGRTVLVLCPHHVPMLAEVARAHGLPYVVNQRARHLALDLATGQGVRRDAGGAWPAGER